MTARLCPAPRPNFPLGQHEQREGVAIGLLHQVGDEAKKIGSVSGIEITSVRFANRFDQMLDNITQLFAEIEFGSTKT